MSRDPLRHIHKYLHFTDNSDPIPPSHPQYNRQCKKPHRESRIDEATVLYKGRSSLEQYMLEKPVRWGLHVWVRADSLTGYVSQFQVYFGKEVSSET
uniref:PiggyBac transposable element-derived protein domain-containing protein n=1 Tax=Amphimedon queenslandica TaxID=400682 RepID=A0A1X7UKV5_AMPQE